MFGFRKKKPVLTRDESMALTPPVYDGDLYSHVKGHEITAGAEVFAFIQRFDKPQYDLIGAGFQAMTQMDVREGPQVYANLAVPNNGVGGLSAGQMVALGLVNNDYSQVE